MEDKKKQESSFEEVAEKTAYAPVTFEADIEEAEKNKLVLKAEEKLLLHNIEVSDRMNDAFLDINLEEIDVENKKEDSESEA